MNPPTPLPVAPPPAAAPDQGRALAVRRFGRIDFVALDELLYVAGAGKYSELVLACGRRDLHDLGLARLAAALPPGFVRIHKSYLVRFNSLARLRAYRGSRYFADLKSGHRLPVCRTHYPRLKAQLI